MNKAKQSLLLLSSLAPASLLNAALEATAFNITGDTVSFQVTGTIDNGVTIGSSNGRNMFFGVPGATDWVLSIGTTRTIVNNGGGSRDFNPSVGGGISRTRVAITSSSSLRMICPSPSVTALTPPS